VLGDDDADRVVPGEISVDHADGFYSYAAKYIDENGATTKVPAELTAEETAHGEDARAATFARSSAPGSRASISSSTPPGSSP
jgi:D-alanine-D-alanine ligase